MRKHILFLILVLLSAVLVAWATPKLVVRLSSASPVIFVVLGVVVAVFVLWLVPKFQVRRLKGKVDPDRLLELEDKARATLAQAIGGSLLLITVYFTWQGLADTKAAQEKQFYIAISGQVTDRFIRAVDQLNAEGKANVTRRLGGIYSLERIAQDSPVDQGPVMEVLTAYVREHAPIVKGKQRQGPPPTDIQAILTVIGRRNTKHVENKRIDLRGTNLSGASFCGANFCRANFCEANLNGAYLGGAYLCKAYLCGANLSGVYLCRADLREAYLMGADLKGAFQLTQKQLDEAITDESTEVDPPLIIRSQKQ